MYTVTYRLRLLLDGFCTAVADHTRAITQPRKVQPRKRFSKKMVAAL